MRLIIVIFILFTFSVNAHQPKGINFLYKGDKPHEIDQPEISKAFYSKLRESPHYYIIKSNKEFLFYVGILISKIDDNVNWFSIDVLDHKKRLIYRADGSTFDWKAWYEPFARDWYWKGPEVGKNSDQDFKTSFLVSSGTYYIKVYSQNNIGS